MLTLRLMNTPSKSALHCAAQKGDLDAVKTIVRQYRDLDDVNEFQMTALHHACQNGFCDIAEFLLDNGACIDTAVGFTIYDYFGFTALHFASDAGKEDIVQLLLRRGANVHSADNFGWVALHYACEKGFNRTAELLLENRACINSALGPTPEIFFGYYTALQFAAKTNKEETVRMLLRKRANVHAVDKDGHTALHIACVAGFWKIVKLLLIDGASVVNSASKNTYAETPLHCAIRKGCEKTVELLLTHGADVEALNYVNETPLSYTCHSIAKSDATDSEFWRRVKILKLLFSSGANVNSVDFSLWLRPAQCMTKPRKVVFEIFVMHLLRKKAQNLYVSEHLLQELYENDCFYIKSFSWRCNYEIVRMQRKSVHENSKVKFFDLLLTKEENKLGDYFTNVSMKQVLKLRDYEAEFPIHASEITDQLSRGSTRKNLLTYSSECLYDIINEFFELPYVCIEKINRYLSNNDLILQIYADGLF